MFYQNKGRKVEKSQTYIDGCVRQRRQTESLGRASAERLFTVVRKVTRQVAIVSVE
jgi:hypothetical protein